MVLVRRRRSFKTIRRWTKATIRFWTNWWTGISIWTLAFVVARFFGPLASLGVAFWLCCEAVNYVVFYVVFQLVLGSGSPLRSFPAPPTTCAILRGTPCRILRASEGCARRDGGRPRTT